jgi:putative oxidoreductase
MARRWTEAVAGQWAVLPLRLIVGYGFIAHGLAKWTRGPAGFGKLLHLIGVPLPTAMAWVVTLLEVFGGLAILLGVLVAIASVPLIASMLVAMFSLQLRYGFSSVNTIGLTPTGPVFGPPGYEINLLYIAALLLLAVVGPGALSLEVWFAKRWRSVHAWIGAARTRHLPRPRRNGRVNPGSSGVARTTSSSRDGETTAYYLRAVMKT